MKMKQPEPPIDYKTSTVTINTCGQLYKEWREKKRLYRQANVTDGVQLEVEFADTLHQIDGNGHEINEAAPVVLCLHGATRTYKDFTHLIHHFRALGKRVIAPNFPSKYYTLLLCVASCLKLADHWLLIWFWLACLRNLLACIIGLCSKHLKTKW